MDGKPLRSSPKHMYSTTLDWQTTSKINTYIQYQGEVDRFNTRYEDGKGGYKDLYYKDFSIWNLGGSYKFNKNFTLIARVNICLIKIIWNIALKKELDLQTTTMNTIIRQLVEIFGWVLDIQSRKFIIISFDE